MRGPRQPSGRACTVPRSAAARWPAAWRSNSSTFWKGCCLPSKKVGGYLHVMLNELARKYSFIKEVRGFGLMIGVEMEIPGKQMVLDAMAEGLLINCTHDTVLRFLPPYIVTERDVDTAVKVLGKIFAKQKGSTA